MKLALDTSQTSGSIALWDSGRVVYSAYFDLSITHSETLMPQVDHALRFCGFRPSDIESVLLAIGPGSFTGLRIGLATAKGIAYGLKIPLLNFSTLRLCALPRYGCGRNILAVMDARMKEVYAALYDENLNELVPPSVCAPREIASWDLGEAYLLGSGALLVEKELNNKEPRLIQVPHQPANAAGLFTLAGLFPQPGIHDLNELAALEPQYLRDSTAQLRRQGK